MNLLRFDVGQHHWCVDRSTVRSRIDAPTLVDAPGAPAWLVGVYNHHGRAVAVIDLSDLFRYGAADRRAPHLVLVESGGHLLGLLAQSVPTDFRPQRFSRRGEMVEVVDRATDLLLVDVSRLHIAIQDNMATMKRI